MTETVELKLMVTIERVDGLILGDLIAAQEGDLKAMRDTLAHFVVNGTGGYMDLEDGTIEVEGKLKPVLGARTLVARLNLGQLKLYSRQLQGTMREKAAPKETGTDSGTPSDSE